MASKEKKFLFELEEIIVGISAILLIISTFLPWGQVGDYSANGLVNSFSSDGPILIGVGALALILLFIDIVYKISAWIPLVLGVIALGIGIYGFINMSQATTEIAGSVGMGLYLAVIASVGITVGAVLDLVRNQ